MTVCVAVKVYDCLVFAADSAVTMSAHEGDSTVWQHGTKVFHLHKQLPIAAMTAGLANFGPASVSKLAKDARIMLSKPADEGGLNEATYSIEEAVEKIQDFFHEAYKQIDPPLSDPHTFELWIGGYGARDDGGEVWKCVIENGTVLPPANLIRADESNGVIWGGQLRAISRLLLGIDLPVFKHILQEEVGLKESSVEFLAKKVKEASETPLVMPAMPVQDAINLADFLVYASKQYYLFLPGANIVGGDTDIAAVTKHERFKWIKRKHYYPADLNRGGTDHVHTTA